MGYFTPREPTPRNFVPRALEFLDRSRECTVHYHYLASLHDRDTIARDDFAAYSGRIAAIRQVKSYAPHLFHFVADVIVPPIS